MSRAKEVDVTADIEKNVARVIDLAVPDFSPVSPNRPRIIFIFLLVGFMGSAGVALGLDRLDNTLKGPQDAETRLGLPVITAMPELSFADNQAENENDQSVIDQFRKEPGGLFAESIRTARTGLMLTALDDPSRVFMITSALPDEGKTSIAFNLAMAMAQSKRTLLIEADMRKPRLAKALGLPADAKGLANLVAGNAESAACMHSLPGSDLKVIPSGDHPPNPLELLSSQRFQRTIEELKTQFDFVVIDTPPVELVSDALAISRVASATLFVARAGRTAVPIVKQSLRRLDRANAKVLGVILNAVDFEKAHKYYGEYSGYGSMQYNGYVYGDDQQPGYGKSRRSGAYGYVSRVLSGGRKPDA
jgi:capsular exopolysaccharide synthesis family protein